MPGNFKTSLEKHLRGLHPNNEALRLQATARKQIHSAIRNAEDVLEPFGYHIAILTDTGSMISAKVYGWSVDHDFKKPKMEKGHPINLQLSPSDERGLTIWSGNKAIVTSKKAKEINDAILEELKTQIKIGTQVGRPR